MKAKNFSIEKIRIFENSQLLKIIAFARNVLLELSSINLWRDKYKNSATAFNVASTFLIIL